MLQVCQFINHCKLGFLITHSRVCVRMCVCVRACVHFEYWLLVHRCVKEIHHHKVMWHIMYQMFVLIEMHTISRWDCSVRLKTVVIEHLSVWLISIDCLDLVPNRIDVNTRTGMIFVRFLHLSQYWLSCCCWEIAWLIWMTYLWRPFPAPPPM